MGTKKESGFGLLGMLAMLGALDDMCNPKTGKNHNQIVEMFKQVESESGYSLAADLEKVDPVILGFITEWRNLRAKYEASPVVFPTHKNLVFAELKEFTERIQGYLKERAKNKKATLLDGQVVSGIMDEVMLLDGSANTLFRAIVTMKHDPKEVPVYDEHTDRIGMSSI